MTARFDDRAIGDLMAHAYRAAMASPDQSTQNGALIVTPMQGIIAVACNEFPPGVEPRHDRPAKYAYIEHAERGAIYCALRNGARTNGATMFCPWSACADCARAIALSGIRTLVRTGNHDHTNDRWRQSCLDGDTILRETGVEIIEWDGPLSGRFTHPSMGPIVIRRDGELLKVA